LEGELRLAARAKGIYKPAELDHAVSIRINVGSPYADGVPVPTGDGGWLLSYHQEGTDPADRDRQYTNRALMRCIADQVPVGVLREVAPASPSFRDKLIFVMFPLVSGCARRGWVYYPCQRLGA
jgi:hypothetical protein